MVFNRRLISAFSLLVGVALAGYARFQWVRNYSPRADSIARLGKQLPPLPAEDLSGSMVDISKSVLGCKSIIAFYSGSCRVCQEVLPELQPFPETLNLLLVDEESGRSSIRHELGIQRAQLFRDANHTLSRCLPMSGVPTILFVDESGVLCDALVGEHARGLLGRKLKEFANEQP